MLRAGMMAHYDHVGLMVDMKRREATRILLGSGCALILYWCFVSVGANASTGESSTPSIISETHVDDGFTNSFDSAHQNYQRYCARCHGANRQGNGSVPSLQNLANKTDHILMMTIAQGVNGTMMPPWSNVLSSEEIRDLVRYLRNATPN